MNHDVRQKGTFSHYAKIVQNQQPDNADCHKHNILNWMM